MCRDMADRPDLDARLRQVSEASLDGVVVLMDGVIAEVNATFCDMTGYGAEELIGESPAKVVAPERLDDVMRRIASEDESVYDSEIVQKDGGRLHVQVRGLAVSVSGQRARLTVIRDLTPLRRATRELAASELRWRALLEQASDGIFVADEQLSLVEANAAACEMLGCTRAELLEMTVPDLGEPEDLARQGLNLEAMREGKTARTERKMVRKDGTTFYAAISARYLPDLGVYHAIARDISDQRAARDRLARSEARFRTVTEHLPQAVGVFREGRIAYVNAACKRLLGAAGGGDLIGRSPLDFVHPDERDDAALRIDGAPEGGATSATDRRMVTMDGREIVVRVVTLPIEYDGQQALMSILHDVTEQQRLEMQLRRAHRMEAVGRMAGGIAHDFNNMLSVILNYAELAKRDVDAESSAHSALVQIVEAARRSAAMTRQLLSFSKHQVVEAEVVDPAEIAERTAKLLRGTLGEHVELSTSTEGQPRRVRIPPSQLEQVIVNLAVNARDAMPDGGELVVETRDLQRDGERWVEIIARDTGCGMTPEVVEHAIDPFYSTKETGEATGLGLSVVYGIVTRNGGTLEIDSEPGRGTTVTIRLPAVDALPDREKPRETPQRPRGHGQRVLIVEDEPAVRVLLVSLLARHGYEARAVTPPEALERARRGEPIDLLLTDVVMPGMNGRALARAMTELRPELRVLYMSGYADDAGDGVDEAAGFLAKPFDLDRLLRAVHDALS